MRKIELNSELVIGFYENKLAYLLHFPFIELWNFRVGIGFLFHSHIHIVSIYSCSVTSCAKTLIIKFIKFFFQSSHMKIIKLW
jgi:hypothetical protein